MSTSTDAVTITRSGDVAVIRLDDGKANALNHEIIDALRQGLREAAQEAGAAVIVGRTNRFSGGFDLSIMSAGPDSALPLLKSGAELALDIYTADIPVVIACTGHAVAMGAILLLAADTRIGTIGDFKIGLNEVAIGMPVPRFAVGLARDRLSPPHLVPAISLARLLTPDLAVQAGFLDSTVAGDEVEAKAVSHAAELAASLNPGAFRLTRRILRGDRRADLEAALAADAAGH